MRKVWIVVANSCYSKIYRAENKDHLIEHHVFVHEESHLPARELVSDQQGREGMRGMHGADTLEEQTPPKVKESTQFAEQISKYLQEGYQAGAVERIYIIAKPPFLGFLRQSFTSNISKIIENEVHKDLTQQTAEQIREYLPPVL